VDVSEVRGVSSRARFEALLDLVLEPVRRFLARRVDAATADDVLGEVMVVLWRRSDEVPPGEEIPWAVGLARHQLANALRSMRRQERPIARIITTDPPPAARVETQAVEPRTDLLREALEHLAAKDAEVLRLSFWDDLSVSEIAIVLGVFPNAVSLRLHRAKGRLAATVRKMHASGGHVVAGGENTDDA
jgi:RNA polymerase sigma-70 factor (ECF subfamily)